MPNLTACFNQSGNELNFSALEGFAVVLKRVSWSRLLKILRTLGSRSTGKMHQNILEEET
jgi:hypothetical protein